METKKQKNRRWRKEWKDKNKEKVKELNRQWALDNPDKVRESSRKWKRLHRDQYNKYRRKWRRLNPDKVKAETMKRRRPTPEENRKNNLKSTYGITIEQYNVIFKKQKGRCAICKRPPTGGGIDQRLCVDHDHLKDRIRELLCGKCNRALGLFSENIKFMESAIRYLRRHSNARVFDGN